MPASASSRRSTRGGGPSLAASFDLLGLAVFVPRRAIGPGFLEGPFDHRLDAHPGVGEPPPRARDVLAQCELHPLGPSRMIRSRPGLPYRSLIDGILAADRVGRPVEQPGGRGSAGQRAVDRDVVARDHVLDPHLGHDRQAPLVHPPLNGDVRVRVDDPRHRHQPGGVDDRHARRAVSPCPRP